MVAVGIAAIAGRPLAVPPILTQAVLVLLGISLGSLVSRQLLQHMSAPIPSPSRCWRWRPSARPSAAAFICSASMAGTGPRRFWPEAPARCRRSPCSRSRSGADVPAIAVVQTMRVIILTAALPLLLALTGIAPSSPPATAVAIASPIELAALIAAARGGGADAAADEISGELDVRRDDRLQRAARHRTGRGRPAALGAQRGAGRHRRADRLALCADEDQDAARPRQCRAGLVCDRHRRFRRSSSR